MPTYVSPGVYVVEKDTSQYPASINPSVVGIVGFASKGPVDKATLITNGERLVKVFGEPDEDIVGQGLEGALEILEATNSLYFVRCAATSAVEASAAIQMGSCPAVSVSAGVGTVSALTLRINGTDGLGNRLFKTDKKITLSLTSTIDTTTSALLNKLGGANTPGSPIGVYDNGTSAYIVNNYAGSAATLEVSAYTDTDGTNLAGGGLDSPLSVVTSAGDNATITNAASASGITFDKLEDRYALEALYPGTGYNHTTKLDGTETGISVSVTTAGGTRTTINILENGSTAESFDVGFLDDEFFIETVINTGDENLKSSIVKGNVEEDANTLALTKASSFSDKITALGFTTVDGTTGGAVSGVPVNGATPRFIKLVQQSGVKFAGGTNGIPDSTDTTNIADLLIGEVTDTGKTGMKVLDNDLLNLGMAAVPGISDESVQNALITIAETSQEFLAVVSPPYAIGSVQNAIDWSNGLDDERTAAINSSYAAIYWPWVKVFSTFDATDRWYDPVIFAIRQMAFTDATSESWFAPAGFTRGRLTKPTDVEIGLSQGDRDQLYSGGNAINPIVNFPQQGITIFGQRTAQRNLLKKSRT